MGACLACVVDRLPHVATGSGDGKVVGELAQMRLAMTRIQGLESLACTPMESDPPRRREVVVEGVSDEGMSESQPSRGPRNVGDDP